MNTNKRGDEDACAAADGCAAEVRYLVSYGTPEATPGGFPVCVAHTAELRAHDPLGYIESVRSIPRAAAGVTGSPE